jgi:hypothetical protein
VKRFDKVFFETDQKSRWNKKEFLFLLEMRMQFG